MYSYKGFLAAWHNEAAFRQEVIIFLISIPFAIWLGDTYVERSLLIGSVLMVVIVELLNSAVEALTDRVSMDHHELSGRAKDMGSAAVLLALLAAAGIWASKIVLVLGVEGWF